MSVVQSFIERFLDPSEWLGEILFGLIMVLTITLGANLLVAEGPRATREIIQSVLGCIFAWSLIDAIIYIMHQMFERSRTASLIEAIKKSATEEQGLRFIQKELNPHLDHISTEEEREHFYRCILRNVQEATVPKTTIRAEDVGGALLTFFLVMITAVPTIVSFLFIGDRQLAINVSNGLLLGMLFLVGWRWARIANTSPLLTGLIVLLLGMMMVGIAKLFGG
ncbi:MAG: VIT1/CCC1 transporter family protein [Gemmatales bacterium]